MGRGGAKKMDGVDYTMVNIGNPLMMLITQQCNHLHSSTILVKVETSLTSLGKKEKKKKNPH